MEFDEYYMNIAMTVRKRANCKGRKVGALLVRDNRVISTGYNGTPSGFKNCTDGGCVRCAKREQYGRSHYDICICVHAEQNAIVAAARFGTSVAGSTAYSTLRPCFNCTKEMLQAGVERVLYLHELGAEHDDPEVQQMYEDLQGSFKRGMEKMEIIDPESDWANGKSPAG